jgi:pyruvate dehydrogenase E2 component (dihydrolipoamide acetyltransferase)
MSTININVPDIGDFDDVPVIEILVAEGDTVSPEDPLVTLESDKATMDVPSPAAGTVKKILVSVEDRVKEGTPLLELESGDASEGESLEADTNPAEQAEPKETEGAVNDSGQPPADGQPPQENVNQSTSAARDGAGSDEATREAPQTKTEYATPTAEQVADAEQESGPIYASPSARRLARELGVDIRALAGSGRLGRITADDVKSGASQPAAGQQASGGAIPGLAPWPKVDFEKFGPVERVPRSRIQKISAPNLARNWVMIPHVTQHDDVDITELEAWRKQLNAEQKDVKYTMVSFLIKAVVASLKAHPDFNSSLDGDELVRKGYYNIGFAADTPNGLVVPVIKNADQKGLAEVAGELSSLSAKARDGKLGPGDISGATFTISSLGGIGGNYFTPIINAPEVAILGVSRSAIKPVWNGSGFDGRLLVPLSLSYDHRVIDGAAAARFIVHLGSVLSDLKRALL